MNWIDIRILSTNQGKVKNRTVFIQNVIHLVMPFGNGKNFFIRDNINF